MEEGWSHGVKEGRPGRGGDGGAGEKGKGGINSEVGVGS